MKERINIGTRGSPLALKQASLVKDRLEGRHPDLSVDLTIIKTKGDKILDAPLAKIGGKGLFVKEIEEALLEGRVDLAVHSMKDVPASLPAGLIMAVIPEREDFRDALVTRSGRGFDDLPQGARVGTSSLRRRAQLLHQRPDLNVLPLRGNVDTRLNKLSADNLDAIVLAAAGLARMDLLSWAHQFLEPDLMLPAVGQGALGLETRKDDEKTLALISFLNHQPTAVSVAAERAFLLRLGGGCQVPLAALARLNGERLTLTGLVADPDGRRFYLDRVEAKSGRAESAGRTLADRLLDKGGREVLKEVYQG